MYVAVTSTRVLIVKGNQNLLTASVLIKPMQSNAQATSVKQQVIKLKYKNNISFAEARKRYSANDRPSYAVTLSASATPKTVSVKTAACQTEYTWLTQSYPTQIIVKPPSSPSTTVSTQTATQPKSKSQPASQSQTQVQQPPPPASPSSSRSGRKGKNRQRNSGRALTRDKSPVQNKQPL